MFCLGEVDVLPDPCPVLSNARPNAASCILLPRRSRNGTSVQIVGALHNKVVHTRLCTRLSRAEPRAPCLSVEHESAAVELDHGLTSAVHQVACGPALKVVQADAGIVVSC